MIARDKRVQLRCTDEDLANIDRIIEQEKIYNQNNWWAKTMTRTDAIFFAIRKRLDFYRGVEEEKKAAELNATSTKPAEKAASKRLKKLATKTKGGKK